MDAEFTKRFLTDTESTGRHIVKSFRTGKVYYIEPIGNVRTNFGDINTATKEVEGSYGQKYKGSVDKSESIVTEENFDKVHELGVGESPYSAIDRIDAQYVSLVQE
jgi:hypothetical protein